MSIDPDKWRFIDVSERPLQVTLYDGTVHQVDLGATLVIPASEEELLLSTKDTLERRIQKAVQVHCFCSHRDQRFPTCFQNEGWETVAKQFTPMLLAEKAKAVFQLCFAVVDTGHIRKTGPEKAKASVCSDAIQEVRVRKERKPFFSEQYTQALLIYDALVAFQSWYTARFHNTVFHSTPREAKCTLPAEASLFTVGNMQYWFTTPGKVACPRFHAIKEHNKRILWTACFHCIGRGRSETYGAAVAYPKQEVIVYPHKKRAKIGPWGDALVMQ
jgi:hypothetical protein